MYHEYFAGRDLLLLPVVAMLAFLITFVGLLFHTLRQSRRPEFEELAALPLREEAGALQAAKELRS